MERQVVLIPGRCGVARMAAHRIRRIRRRGGPIGPRASADHCSRSRRCSGAGRGRSSHSGRLARSQLHRAVAVDVGKHPIHRHQPASVRPCVRRVDYCITQPIEAAKTIPEGPTDQSDHDSGDKAAVAIRITRKFNRVAIKLSSWVVGPRQFSRMASPTPNYCGPSRLPFPRQRSFCQS